MLTNMPPTMSRHPRRLTLAAVLLAVVALPLAIVSAQGGRKFFADDPLWVEPITQDAKNVTRYEPNLFYEMLVGLTGPGDPVLGQRAKNLNTIDEVPDGSIYTNRAGRIPLTPALVARAANTSPAPAPGPWAVVSAKSDGVTPGFTIRDASNALWFIKFDPPKWPAMATGSEMVSAKLFWAIGYHTAEYHIERLTADRLQVAPDAKITPFGEGERRMRQADVAALLKRAARTADGGYRVIASKGLPGRPVGRIRFDGTRADDPNDVILHEHRRELRAYAVFAAWLNHVDLKATNSMTSLITENGRSFIRGYLLDFGSTLGSAAIKPRERWEGYEGSLEPPKEIGKRIIGFGFVIPEWRTMEFYEAKSVGRLPADHKDWDPEAWRGHLTTAAFKHARADDRFWAAHKLTFITNEIIDAVVAEGRFNDPPSEKLLAEMIKARRDRIVQRYLPAVNPIVEPVLEIARRTTDGSPVTKSQLTFTNAAVAAKVASAPQGYTAEWSTFDNATGAATVIGTTRGAASPLDVPQFPPATTYIRVRLSATNPPRKEWGEPVSIFFRTPPPRDPNALGQGRLTVTDSWQLVGFERMP